MSYSFDQFCADCRQALKSDPGPSGREQVRKNLEKLLNDPDFVAAECGDDAKVGIRTIYKDDETDFNVLVHIYEAGKTGPPHDHGKSWAVYGQASEWTDMTVWKRLDEQDENGKAKLAEDKAYRLDPGMAGTFEPGDIHSIHFPDGARFVRVTGTNLDEIPTYRFDPDNETVAVGSRLQ